MSLNVNSGSQDYKNKLKKTMQQTFKIKCNRVKVKVTSLGKKLNEQLYIKANVD